MTRKTKPRAGWREDGYAIRFKPWRTATHRGPLSKLCTSCYVEVLR